MKIYNSVTIDIDTGQIIEEDSYDYKGPVATAEPTTILFAFMAVMSMFMQYMQMQNMDNMPDMELRGIEVNTRSSKEPIAILYGKRKIGGNDVYVNTGGEHSKDLWIVQTLSEGQCSTIVTKPDNEDVEIDQVWVDDKLYTEFPEGTVEYTYYDGSNTQEYPTGEGSLNDFDNSWVYNLRNTAYILWHFFWNEDYFRGIPQRQIELKGIQCYDFRTETTAWTDNPVICLYDFMTNTRYGLAIPSTTFDLTSWTAAANYCDDQDWHLNLCIKPGQENNSWSIVETILSHFRGNITWWDGKYYVKIADLYEESSVFTITDDHIMRDDSGQAIISISQPSRFNRPDGLRVTFIDERNNYTENYIYLGEQDGVVEDFRLLGCTNMKMAGDLGVTKLERLRLDRIITGTFRGDCIAVEPGDVVTLSSTALHIENQLLRVQETTLNTNGTVTVVFSYENYSLYDDEYQENMESSYVVNLPNPNEKCNIANAGLSEELYYYNLKYYSRLLVTFTTPENQPWFDHVQVWVSTNGDVQENYKHQTIAKNSFYLDPVNIGQEYYIVLVPVNIWKVKQIWNQSPKLYKKIEGNSSVRPPSPNVLKAIPGDGLVNLISEKIYSPDIEHYEFRFGASWSSGIFLASTRSPNYSIKGIKPSGTTPFVFSLNTRGSNDLYGDTPQTASCVIPLPTGWSDYTDFDFNPGDSGHVYTNTQVIDYNEEDWIGVITSSETTTGTFLSRIYDTGITAEKYLVYVDNEITVTGTGTTWADQFPTTWLNGNVNLTWLKIFELDEAPVLNMKIWYRDSALADWSIINNAELLTAVVTARYFRVEIEIVNPNTEIRALVSSYSLKLLTSS
jgi:hypothetical protein